MGRLRLLAACGSLLLLSAPALAQTPLHAPASMAEIDAYTRYELLAPGSGKFRILYEVTQKRAGARHFFNPIRKGSIATDESVTDLASGKPLAFAVVDGKVAQAEEPDADPTYQYISVTLARPVPADGGEGRMLIDKTYEDRNSYFTDGGDIVFSRSLGVKRNSVVLPKGYRLVSSNYPSQVIEQADGRIMVSFWNATPAEAPLVVRARPGEPPATTPSSLKLRERANEDLAITYFLQQPETHSFDLFHDLTESRAGVDHHINVVRTGSTASNPAARNLDTGEALKPEPMKSQDLAKAGLAPGQPEEQIDPGTDIILFRFAPLKPKQSVRLRISETYTDPVRYTLVGDELVWRRSFGRAADAIVLPKGWVLTNCSIPAAVSLMDDGRTRLDFINGRPDEIDVQITARRAAAS
jgi:hypothetical protein